MGSKHRGQVSTNKYKFLEQNSNLGLITVDH